MLANKDVVSDARDIEYVRAHFISLADACSRAGKSVEITRSEIAAHRRPLPSYTFADGTPYVPLDYFELELDHEKFLERLMREYECQGVEPSKGAIEEAWEGLLSGLYSVCLRNASPENIVHKNVLLARIDDLVSAAEPSDAAWVATLRDAVDQLDAIEQPFSPVLDRRRFGKPPTRDSYITAVRESFLNDAG